MTAGPAYAPPLIAVSYCLLCDLGINYSAQWQHEAWQEIMSQDMNAQSRVQSTTLPSAALADHAVVHRHTHPLRYVW